MPRACPVVLHDHCYLKINETKTRCHGLAPWSAHVRSYIATNVNPPRDKPVASRRDLLTGG